MCVEGYKSTTSWGQCTKHVLHFAPYNNNDDDYYYRENEEGWELFGYLKEKWGIWCKVMSLIKKISNWCC